MTSGQATTLIRNLLQSLWGVHPRRFVILRRACHLPFPVADFRQVLTVFIYVLLVLDQLIRKLLLEVDAPVTGLPKRQRGGTSPQRFGRAVPDQSQSIQP